MTIVRTDLGDTRESARKMRFEPSGTITQTNLQEAMEQVSTQAQVLATVATLPAVATVPVGARAFVTDSNATLAAGLGNTVAAGGANKVPVYSDGVNWKIGG